MPGTEPELVGELEELRTPLSEVHPDPQNPNMHPMRSIEALKQSMEEHGQDQPIVARKADGRIVKGNGRYMAAQQLGWQEAAVLFVEDDELTAIRRGLADHGTERLGFVEEETLRDALREVGADERPVAGIDADTLEQLKQDVLEHDEEDEGTDPEEAKKTFEEGEQRQVVLYFTGPEYEGEVADRLERAREEAGVEKNAELFAVMMEEHRGELDGGE